MYFLVDALNVLDRVYQYSMANFVYILKKGMDVTPGGTDQSKVAEHLRTPEPLSVDKKSRRAHRDDVGDGFRVHRERFVRAAQAHRREPADDVRVAEAG